MEVDFKALEAIQMCLPNEVFHNFRGYKTAKELWEALEKMVAGSEEVKENRRDILKQQYENFVWKEGESLTVLFNSYTYLVGELQYSKVKLENEDILKKFIRSLPSCWSLYTVSIRRTENLKTLQMTELLGMLKTYELEMIQAKERSSSYQTVSTSTTTSSALHSDHSVRDVPTKFSAKAIEGIFLGYVANSTTMRVYNKETRQDAQNSGFLPTMVPQSSVPFTSVPDRNVASCSGTQESDNEDENVVFQDSSTDHLIVDEPSNLTEA
ncbi:hypothetical protein L1987_27628 [Smallanthus sonchifolius]|uniref:Uncharacterized protein n=1 Tax=Smallanthus sonchifolius TaxID=185202 RepID=A0ACB9ICS5_9ASTR|nr:hypothetical protein L1987_27628 [Smallanthus sonchifolius]